MSSNNLASRFLSVVVAVTACAVWGCSNSNTSTATTTAGDVTAGKTALAKYQCTTCHGQDLAGNTQAFPGAANLTPDKETGLADWDAATIKAAILTGKDDGGKTLCSTMPVFAKMNMSDTEATNIVAYLQSIMAVSKKVPDSPCLGSAAGSGGK